MVSVVVPIYRVEKYLRKCVDSLLQQTYKNIEIILVDDGSPDACPEICDELKKTDDIRFLLININSSIRITLVNIFKLLVCLMNEENALIQMS